MTTSVPGVGLGFFPLDEQLAVWDGHWSEGVVRQAVWLSGLLSYREAAEVLQRVGGIPMSESSLWRRAERWAERFLELEEEREAQARGKWQTVEERVRAEAKGVERLGMAMDGVMVHVREEGWKELEETAHAVACSYIALYYPARSRTRTDGLKALAGETRPIMM